MDMTVTVNGPYSLARYATRMVFGEDANAGPVMLAPQPLLEIKENWPANPHDPVDIALQMPWDFDVERDLGGRRNALVLRVNRITILHEGKAVGYAIRTDRLGINALVTWTTQRELFNRHIRQAH